MRRVVTGLDSQGKSTILSDGQPLSINATVKEADGSSKLKNREGVPATMPERHICLVDLWQTTGIPARDDADPFTAPMPFAIEPPGGGWNLRYYVWGPGCDVALHATQTLDVNFILSGSIEMILETGRTVLNAGDMAVLPGTVHGWRTGPDGATLINIMQKLAD